MNWENGDYDLEILQWGANLIDKNDTISLYNVSKIYEPEQENGIVWYRKGKFTEIPEWLYSKKITNTKIGGFDSCKNITSIPENLFKYNVNITEFDNTFLHCPGLTSIPEGLFKENINVTDFTNVFYNCPGLTSIPENLFKTNINVKSFNNIFLGC